MCVFYVKTSNAVPDTLVVGKRQVCCSHSEKCDCVAGIGGIRCKLIAKLSQQMERITPAVGCHRWMVVVLQLMVNSSRT